MADTKISNFANNAALTGAEEVASVQTAGNVKISVQEIANFALNNSAHTGVPTAPTAAPGTNTTQLATTAFANAVAALRILLTEKGAALGVVPLNAATQIDTTYLPPAVLGQVEYKGIWDATSGVPTGSPEKGWYYIVSVAGTTNLDGITDWKVGDWAIYNGTAWNKVDNTDAVSSVAGLVGVITAAALKTALDLSGTNSGDQTSIVGIAGTIAQFNTACSDADFATGGGTATGANTGDQTFLAPRIQTIVSAATITANASTNDMVVVTALAVDAELANFAGIPVQGQTMFFRIEDDGTPRNLTYGTQFRAFGSVVLPATTTAGKTLYLAGKFNTTDTTFDVLAVGELP